MHFAKQKTARKTKAFKEIFKNLRLKINSTRLYRVQTTVLQLLPANSKQFSTTAREPELHYEDY